MTDEQIKAEEKERWDNVVCCDCGEEPKDNAERLSMVQFGQCDKCYRAEQDRNIVGY